MLLNQCCAFVDIETTGANYRHGAITEIAVTSVLPDGDTDQWQQLLNPCQAIPPFIQRLTGITPAMVQQQPLFEEIAAELHERLSDAIFVAHNARFDYGFIKQAFSACGFSFKPTVLCTVKLARALYPQWPKHSLDALCQHMHYERDVAHRAMADVEAMLTFVQYAVADFGLEAVNAACAEQLGRSATPIHIEPQVIDALPDSPGVYRFYGEYDRLLYVGKSVTIKTRVKSHFAESIRNSKELRLSQEVRRIEVQQTAGDLSAQLLENREIKTTSPVYNRRQRAYKKLWSVVLSNQDGVLVPEISNDYYDATGTAPQARYGMYRSRKSVQKWLDKLAQEQQLCRKALGQEKGSGPCFAYQLKKCHGICAGAESPAQHNLRLLEALDKQAINPWPFEGAVVFEEAPRHTETGAALAHLHVVDQWVYLGSVSDYDQLDSVFSGSYSTAFDKETYQILRRFMHLAKPIE